MKNIIIRIKDDKDINKLNLFFNRHNITWASGSKFNLHLNNNRLHNQDIEVGYFLSHPDRIRIRFSSYTEPGMSVDKFIKENILEQYIFEYNL